MTKTVTVPIEFDEQLMKDTLGFLIGVKYRDDGLGHMAHIVVSQPQIQLFKDLIIAAQSAAPKPGQQADVDRLKIIREVVALTDPYDEHGCLPPKWDDCIEFLDEHGYLTHPALQQRITVDKLAQIIREVDGNNELGAGALAEAIIQRLKGEA